MTATSRDTWDRGDALDRIRAGVDELTRPVHVVERYHLDPRDAEHTAAHDASPGVRQGKRKKGKGRTARTRVGTVPSLLDQLGRMLEPAVSGEASSSGGSFESSPPIALEPVDVYARIAVEAWSSLILFGPDVAVERQRGPASDRLAAAAASVAAVDTRMRQLSDLMSRAVRHQRNLRRVLDRVAAEIDGAAAERHAAQNAVSRARRAVDQVDWLFAKLAAARSARDVRAGQLRSVEGQLAAARTQPFTPVASDVARTLTEIATLATIRDDNAEHVATWQREIVTIVGRIAGSQSPTVPVLALNGVAAQLPDWQLRRLDSDVARWLDAARIAARVEPVPAPVNEPCPVCGKPNSVVVRGDRDTSTAECRNPFCGAHFEHWQMGMFARLVSERQTLAKLADDTEITRKDEAIAVLDAAREAAGLTKTRLAELVDVTETQVYRVFSPTRKWPPSDALLHRMAAAIHTHQHEGATP